jgi:hypothetical protein
MKLFGWYSLKMKKNILESHCNGILESWNLMNFSRFLVDDKLKLFTPCPCFVIDFLDPFDLTHSTRFCWIIGYG